MHHCLDLLTYEFVNSCIMISTPFSVKKSCLLSLLLASMACSLPNFGQAQIPIDTSDISLFWEAYEAVVSSADSVEQLDLLQQMYLSKGSAGLAGMVAVRRYAPDDFIQAMMSYPAYWQSLRGRSPISPADAQRMQQYFAQLQAVYPALQPAKVYFPVGGFKSAGTYQRRSEPGEPHKILLGAEYYLSDAQTPLHELPQNLQWAMQNYRPYDLPLIALHEYIHTQQKPWENYSIVHLAVGEGVAEFISTLLTGAPYSPSVRFGKANAERVRDRFVVEMLRDDDVWNWLWNVNENELGERDLAYYIGYEICERYYNRAADKQAAIRELIELDYADDAAFARVLDESGYLPWSWEEIGRRYEAQRPSIKRVLQFENGSQRVSPKTKQITVEFSEPIGCCRNFDYDESLPGAWLKIKSIVGWSADQTQFTFEVEDLQPHTEYHLILSNFAKADGGNRSVPYVLRFKTGR